jgi:hypothetical protein
MRSIGRRRLPAVNYWQAEIRTGGNPGNPKGMHLMTKTTDIREAVQAELDFDPLFRWCVPCHDCAVGYEFTGFDRARNTASSLVATALDRLPPPAAAHSARNRSQK